MQPEDAIGASLFDWVMPDQHQAVRQCVSGIFETARPTVLELNGIQGLEPGAWYECRFSANLRDGRVISATVIARDITRHRRALIELREKHELAARLLEERSADLVRVESQLADVLKGQTEGDANDRRFRALLDEAGEAVFVTDALTGALVDVNETACRWLRCARAELIGRGVQELALGFPIQPPDNADLQFTETRDTRRPAVLNRGEHRRSDGSKFPVEVAVAHHTIGEEEVYLAVVRDIKVRQRAEEALRECEAKYQALLEQSWDAVYVTTRAGIVTHVNEPALALFGYTREEFTGLDARELFPEPDDIRAFQRATSRGDRGVVRLALQLQSRVGRRISGEVAATRLEDRAGRVLGYQCAVRAAEPAAPVAEAAAPVAEAVAPVAEAVAPAAEAVPEAPVVRPKAHSNGTVLLVERDRASREEARLALEQAGMRVLVADSPESGVSWLRDHAGKVAAAILSTDPHDASWGAAIREMRRVDPAVRLVVVSETDPLDPASGVPDFSASAFVPRPAHPLALVQAVHQVRASGGEFTPPP